MKKHSSRVSNSTGSKYIFCDTESSICIQAANFFSKLEAKEKRKHTRVPVHHIYLVAHIIPVHISP